MLRFSGPDFLLPHGILTAAARAFPFSRHCGDVTLSRPLDTRSDMRCTDRWLERIFLLALCCALPVRRFLRPLYVY